MKKVQYLYTQDAKVFGELKYTQHIFSEYTKHFHTHLGLALVEEGELHIVYDVDTKRLLNNHSLALFNPYQIHCSTAKDAQGYYVLFLDKQWCQKIEEDFYFENNILHDSPLYKDVLNIFHKVLSTTNLSIESELRSIMKKIFSNYTSKNIKDESNVVSKIKSFIEENNTGTVSVDDIARYVGYNKSYLIRFFKKEVGMTPQQYILNIKVNRAKDLLIYGDEASLSTVSVNAGFFDQSHFNRNFKGHFGASPKSYKKVNIIQDTKTYV